MSLLLDALRKAEASRDKLGENPDTAAEVREALTLEPIDLDMADLPPAAPRPAASVPPLAGGERPRRGAAPPPNEIETQARENARQIFNAKPAPSGPSIALLAVGIGCIVALAGGAYVWWQTRPIGLGAATQAEGPAPAPARTIPPPAQPSPRREQLVAPPPASGRAASVVAHAPRVTDERDPTEPPATADDATSIRVQRTLPATSAPTASPLDNAYAAYEKGDLATARTRYLEGWQRDPHATDALDGLGAIALRQGQNQEAERWFLKSLAINPRNAVAQSGLITATQEPDVAAAESRLRNLLHDQPEVTAAHIALGHVLARSGRWAEAQESYFKAFSLDPENPDVLFNLAVALDHLNQRTLALDYYDQALTAATRRPATFDRKATALRRDALASH